MCLGMGRAVRALVTLNLCTCISSVQESKSSSHARVVCVSQQHLNLHVFVCRGRAAQTQHVNGGSFRWPAGSGCQHFANCIMLRPLLYRDAAPGLVVLRTSCCCEPFGWLKDAQRPQPHFPSQALPAMSSVLSLECPLLGVSVFTYFLCFVCWACSIWPCRFHVGSSSVCCVVSPFISFGFLHVSFCFYLSLTAFHRLWPPFPLRFLSFLLCLFLLLLVSRCRLWPLAC